MSAAGALLGLAAGDTLGSGYEGQQPEDIGRGRISVPRPGSRYTDDTQQALVLAYHLLDHQRVVPEILAEDLAGLADGPEPGVYRGIGPGFRAFLDHLAEGSGFAAAAQPSAGNGAAMRVTPIAIRFRDDLERVAAEAVEASLVTHADPVGVAAAVAVATAVWAAAKGQVGADLVHSAADAAADVEHRIFADYFDRLAPGDRWHDFSDALYAVADHVGHPPAAISRRVGARAARLTGGRATTGTHPYAAASVVTALCLAASFDPADPFRPIEEIVALGGDTDTMAAMAGATIGARVGVIDWPWEVANQEIIAEVARRLERGDVGTEGLPPLRDVESMT